MFFNIFLFCLKECSETLSGHWCFLMPLHVLVISFRGLIIFLLVMHIGYVFHVGRAAVAYINVVFTEELYKICGVEENAY